VADILDISCLYAQKELYPIIQNEIFTSWIEAPESSTPNTIFGDQNVPVLNLGPHYFVPNPITGIGISPMWDYSKSIGDPNAVVIAAKVGGIPAPDANDVDWLSLSCLQCNPATLAQIFRVETKGGTPPASVRGLTRLFVVVLLLTTRFVVRTWVCTDHGEIPSAIL
jgi:hypothetical protein